MVGNKKSLCSDYRINPNRCSESLLYKTDFGEGTRVNKLAWPCFFLPTLVRLYNWSFEKKVRNAKALSGLSAAHFFLK